MRFIAIWDYMLSMLHTLFLSMKSNVCIGKGSLIYRCTVINCKSVKKGGVYIGENCRLGCSPKEYHAGMPFFTKLLCDTKNAKIVIGNNCRINGAYIHAQDCIKIGNNCVMASGIHIIDCNGHEINSLDRTKGRDVPKEIIIGNNVWIGLNSIVLKGSIIGDNSIISAGSVVKGTVPPDVIYSTNDEITIKKIEK